MLEILQDIRFSDEARKINGIHYTPPNLSSFVAQKILDEGEHLFKKSAPIRIFDPAVGDGELLKALSEKLSDRGIKDFEIFGFDTNPSAINISVKRLSIFFNNQIHLLKQDFLDYILNQCGDKDLFNIQSDSLKFDFVISNPPYVRTQHLGAEKAQEISRNFGLRGRVDLYQPFIIGISKVLKEGGVAGIIVSNRLLTTRSGASLRKRILEEFDILHVWDMGDTKFFNAAVLPAVIFLKKKEKNQEHNLKPRFSSIYEVQNISLTVQRCNTLIDALDFKGVVNIDGDQSYVVRHGELDVEKCIYQEGVWRLSDNEFKKRFSIIEDNTHCKFGDIGKIRVGVKTTADDVFIHRDWKKMCGNDLPELLRPLTTHYIARRYNPLNHDNTQILYTHEMSEGVRKVVDMERYPNSFKYLNRFKDKLSDRKYVVDAGRKWFEIWVPHHPELWERPKVIFRDISEKPTFWMDVKKTVVNGDCYWFTNEKEESEDLLWLAMAVGNSTFIEFYYDQMFNNKLYSNRRRFMTQYVEKFPIPNPNDKLSKKIMGIARETFKKKDTLEIESLADEIDGMVWKVFGLSREKIGR